MKKAFMLVAAIALLAAPVFAEVAVTISGEATTSFGYNIDDSTYGMLSEVSSDVEVVVGTLDGEKMGEGNWYGVITLDGAGLTYGTDLDGDMLYVYADDDDDDVDDVQATYDHDNNPATPEIPLYIEQDYVLTAPDVTAKITNGNIYIQLQTEADFDADFVDDSDMEDEAQEFADADTAGSVTVGGTFAPVSFAVEFGTAGSYEDAAQVDGVAFGANITVDLTPITVDVAYAGAYGYAVNQETGFAVKVGADLAPVAVTAAFDGRLLSGDFFYEAGLAVDLTLDPLTVALDVYFAEENLDTKVTVGFANDMLSADAYFGLYDILRPTGADMVWETGVDVTVTPVSGIEFNAGWSYASDDIMTAYADVSFTELVDNVTFTIGWENADDMLDKDADETNMGDIYVAAKIAY